MEDELKNLKKLLEEKNSMDLNKGNINNEDIKIFLNNFLDNFKLENEKLSIYNQTKNSLIENIIKNEFEKQNSYIKNIFEENNISNSYTYKIIEYLNLKLEELFGYKTKAERYQSQTEMLLNEQKILKDQIKVYRKIASDATKISEIQKENIAQYKMNENVYHDIIKRTKEYIKGHFSKDLQNELFKLLDKKE